MTIELRAEIQEKIETLAPAETVSAIRAVPLTADGAQFLTELCAEFAQGMKDLEEKKQSVVRPMNAAITALRKLFKPAEEAYATVDQAARERLKEYHRSEQAKAEESRRAALAAVEAARRARVEQAKVEASTSVDEAVRQDVQASVQAAEQTARTAIISAVEPEKISGSSTRKVWCYEVVDATAVPRDLCTPDDRLIRARVTALGDQQTIPGVRIWSDVQLTIRSK